MCVCVCDALVAEELGRQKGLDAAKLTILGADRCAALRRALSARNGGRQCCV